MPDASLLSGTAFLLLAAGLALFVAFRPRYTDIKLSRRRPESPAGSRSAISILSGATVAAVERGVGPGRGGPFGRDALEGAGVKSSPAEFIVLVLAGSLALGTMGFMARNLLLALLLAAMAPVGAWLLVVIKDRPPPRGVRGAAQRHADVAVR